MSKLAEYRPCVGIVLFNKKGEVWMGKRYRQRGPYCWQFPQGGIDTGERPKAAALRELWEETGIRSDHIRYLGKTKGWLTYDYPTAFRGRKVSRGWKGQKQKWFAYEFIGKRKDFDLKAHKPPEFSKWRWEDLTVAPDLIVPFKKEVYLALVAEFEGFSQTQKKSKAK